MYDVSSDSYVASMGGRDGEAAPTQRQFSEAKGGGFFFFSADKRYMVKTMSEREHRTMLQILPELRRRALRI